MSNKATSTTSTKQTASDMEEYAFDLYCRGELQKEIARKTGFSEKTISKWANDPKKDWESKKKSLLTNKTEILKNLYNVLLKLNTKLMDDKHIGDTKLADAFVKYTAAIKNLETETSTGQMIETGMQFIKHVQGYDFDFAKKLAEAFNGFILDQLKRFK